VVAVEPDWGGLRIDHPDREALDLIHSRNIPRNRQPDLGLTLHRRFADAGLVEREVTPLPSAITDFAVLSLYGLDLRPDADGLVAEGRLDRERADAALAYLDTASRDGVFFACIEAFLAFGRVPVA
jgi:hypothetical protein